MRILLQRVTFAEVTVESETVGSIQRGYVLLTGVGHGDTEQTADGLAEKIVKLRLFPNDRSGFDRSLLDVEGGALVVPQFTLYADARKGRRPSFTGAAAPAQAEALCDHFANRLRAHGVGRVETGSFGAHMQVKLENDGPVTLWLDTDELNL